jgi:CRISPR-associated protein Csd1
VIALLQELRDYVQAQGLPTRPGYNAKTVRWVIVLNEDGRYIDVEEDRRTFPKCPDLGQPELASTGGKHSQFLVDTLSVVTGYALEEGDEKTETKHGCFISLLKEASGHCPELGLCARALEDDSVVARGHATLKALKAKGTDKATFRVGQRFAPEMTGWRKWWEGYRADLYTNEAEEEMVCLATGELIRPALTHNLKIKLSRVGGQPSGSSLISFDKDAFASYGLAQSTNGACSEAAAVEYATALNDLIGKAPPPLGGALMLHWYRERIPDEDDPFPEILSFGDDSDAASARNKARELLTAVRSGKRPELTGNRYFVLPMSGSGGRVMVRDWFTGDFVRLVEGINAWYDDLEIVKPHGGEMAEPPKLRGLLTRLVSYRPGEKYQDTMDRVDKQLAPLLSRLWRAILEGGPLPDAAAQGALAHARSRLLREEDDRSTGNLDRVACAVLKGWFVRRSQAGHKETAMHATLNKEHPAPAYQAGRLMAVLAALQTSALGDVGAGVVQRYYAAASTTPSLVLGRLVRNAQFHLQKIENKGLMVWYEKQIAEIMSKLGDQPPAMLDLEGQTLFALGYYQQKAALYGGAKTETATNEAKEGGDRNGAQ